MLAAATGIAYRDKGREATVFALKGLIDELMEEPLEWTEHSVVGIDTVLREEMGVYYDDYIDSARDNVFKKICVEAACDNGIDCLEELERLLNEWYFSEKSDVNWGNIFTPLTDPVEIDYRNGMSQVEWDELKKEHGDNDE
jgi:hypothetical protein